MRVLRLLAVAAALLLPTDSALGEAGAIMLYTDDAFTSCNVTEEPAMGEYLYVYAVHEFASAKASRWALRNNGHLLTWFRDQNWGPGVGQGSQLGWAIAYRGCQDPPWWIATIWYQRLNAGTSPVCSSIEVVADREDVTGQITGSDCDDNMTFPEGGRLTFYDDGACPCGLIPPPLPVEETTWGRVKALHE